MCVLQLLKKGRKNSRARVLQTVSLEKLSPCVVIFNAVAMVVALRLAVTSIMDQIGVMSKMEKDERTSMIRLTSITSGTTLVMFSLAIVAATVTGTSVELIAISLTTVVVKLTSSVKLDVPEDSARVVTSV